MSKESQGRATADRVAATTVARWFDLHVDTIHRYVSRRAGHDVALDVTADTFRVALESFHQFEPRRGSELAWLYGIATNLLRRHWRTEQRRLRTQLRGAARTPSSTSDPSLAVDERVDAHHDFQRLMNALEQLNSHDRDLIILTAVERLSSAQVSEALGIPASTARARIRRIRSELRAHQGGPS